MTITLSGEPHSTNHLYKPQTRGRFAGIYLSSEGEALKLHYQQEARAQWRGKPLKEDVELWITLYFGTRRRADIDNYNKLSLDALTGIVYEDDSQIQALHIERSYDKQNPRIEIEVVH